MFNKLTIRLRLLWLVGFYSLLLIGGSILGIGGMYTINRDLDRVYMDRTIPLQQLAAIDEMLLKNRLAIANAALEPTSEVIRENTALVERNIDAIAKLWDVYAAGAMTPEERELSGKFSNDSKRFVDEGLRPAVDLLRGGKIREVQTQIRTSIRPLFEPVESGVKALIKLQIDIGREEYENAQRLYSLVRNVAIAGVAGAILLGVLVALVLIRSIVGAIRISVGVATRIAEGQLANRIDVDRSDELGELLRALQTMSEGLQGIVRDVREGAQTVANASAEMARGNSDLSSRTEQQASTLEQTASSMEELTTTVKQSADNARHASQLATGASDAARKGGQAMAGVVGTMQGIAEASGKIADIIGVIDGIAFQTNILALNAAVEAARAGEQGRGFAVVASEVRSLAQRSAGAAKEIKILIDDSVARVTEGEQLVEHAGETIAEAITEVRKVTDVIAEIAATSQEQLAGIEQVGNAVTQMDRVVQQNAALVEESAAAADQLTDQADSLVKVVERFNLGDQQYDSGRAAGALPAARRVPGRSLTPTAGRGQPLRGD